MRSYSSSRLSPQPSLNQQQYAHWVRYASSVSNRQPVSPSRPQSAGPRISYGWLCAVLVLAALLIGAHTMWSQHAAAQRVAVQAAASARIGQFSKSVNTLLAAQAPLDMTVVAGSDTQALQRYGTAAAYDGASTGKLLTAADYLHHVQTGSASLQQYIDGQRAQDLLEKMIVNSDDIAWLSLNNYLGHDDLSRYAAALGFAQYDVATNTFPAEDIAVLLQKLYSGQLLPTSQRELLLTYMGRANYRDYIVAAVPAGDTVYHKVGMDADDVHDAAIIQSGRHWLVLVIFTNGHGTYNWDHRAQLMQTITKQAIAAYL